MFPGSREHREWKEQMDKEWRKYLRDGVREKRIRREGRLCQTCYGAGTYVADSLYPDDRRRCPSCDGIGYLE